MSFVIDNIIMFIIVDNKSSDFEKILYNNNG